MIVNGREYLTYEEVNNVYADTSVGVDIQSKIDKYSPSNISATDCFVFVVDGVPQEIKSRPDWFHNDGTPVTDEFLNSENYYNYFTKVQPLFDPYIEIVEECPLKEYSIDHDSKRVIQEWKKRILTDEEKEEYIKLRWQEIRKLRNDLLLNSDWTQTNDQPDDFKSKWAVYRKKLRDLPEQFSDPRDVIFPEKPE